MVFNAARYISNKPLHEDSGVPFAEDEINRLTNSYPHNLPHTPMNKSVTCTSPQHTTAPTVANRCVTLNGTTS